MNERPHNPSEAAYPTVVSWPDGFDRDARTNLLTGTGVFDRPSANLLAGRTAPMILCCCSEAIAGTLVQATRQAGGDAFAPTMAQIAALGPTMKIRTMRIEGGNLDVDLWQGLSTTIRREHIQFLVRGRVPDIEHDERARRVVDQVRDNVRQVTGYNRFGWAVRIAAESSISRLQDEASRTYRSGERLDLHTSSGAVFQVDADKFAFTVLGQMKGYNDRVNMNKLCELLSHIAPNDVVDDYFGLFRPPPDCHDLLRQVPEMRRANENPIFAFYSRWSALMYRHVMGLSTT